MKPVLEVFFDYACPYCMRAHESLVALREEISNVDLRWCPCEAHPRPDRYGMHSDLCIQGMYFAMDQGIDLWAYHDLMYRAIFAERIDVENPRVLSSYVQPLMDSKGFLNMLHEGTYQQTLRAANRYAYEQSDVWVVPAYRSGTAKMDATEDIGVTYTQLQSFLASIFDG